MKDEDLIRLSAWVFFVNHGENMAIHHTGSGDEWMTDREVARRLEQHTGFRPLVPDMNTWVDRGVLVRPFKESLVAPSGSSEEGRLSTAWNEWYWKREVEAEREYRWQGEVVLKMPDDLFMYQELMFDLGIRRVLEVGYGRGGGLWFFASILAWSGGGHVVGVDWDPPNHVPDFRQFPSVRVDRVHGDAQHARTISEVRALASAFDLIVIDADPTPEGKLALLERWTPLLGGEGAIVVEDLVAPECATRGDSVSTRIDQYLIFHRDFGLRMKPRRFATSKANRVVLERGTVEIELEKTGAASRLREVTSGRISDDGRPGSQNPQRYLLKIAQEIQTSIEERGFYYRPAFSTDQCGALLLDLARVLGSIHVPPGIDWNRPLIETRPCIEASDLAPFDRAEGIGWHSDFSTHASRPRLSLANLIRIDPDGPSGGAWRVASCDRIFDCLRANREGREALQWLVEHDLPYNFGTEGTPQFYRAVESRGSERSWFGLRFYGRAIRDGARLRYGSVPEEFERMIEIVETAADRVGHVIAAPAGALLVTDNWRSLHDRLPQCVDAGRELRTSLLCFVD